MTKLHAVIFDLDGTLIKSKIDYEKMANEIKNVLVSEGIPVKELDDRVKVYRFILEGEKAFKNFCMGKEKIDKIQDRLRDTMNRVELETVDLVEKASNAEKTLRSLKQRGLDIGIATRGSHKYAEKTLNITGMRDYIDVMVARDRVEKPKPNPLHLLKVIDLLNTSTEKVIYVGDSPTDFMTSRAAGVAFYGYRRSPRWTRRLIEIGCEKIIDDLYDIIDIVDAYS